MSQSLNPLWEVLHITEAGSMQLRIDTVPKEKALHAAAEDCAPGSNCLQNGPVAEVDSALVDQVAFKVKANISMVLHQVSEAESALHNMECSSQGPARSLCKARQSLEEGWQYKHLSWHMPVLAPNILLWPWI